jgi:hypothetical protein
MHAA